MKHFFPLKIDAYSHIVPPGYKGILDKVSPKHSRESVASKPPLYDLDQRFRIMDRYERLLQVLTLAAPPIEQIADPEKGMSLAKQANDEMAELVLRFPDRFVGAIACLPMNNMDFALKEMERAIRELRLRGIQVYTPVNEKPLDSPEFIPLYEEISKYNLPIYIHPMRSSHYPDYRTEDISKYHIYGVFGWPYETTVAMARLVFSGILERYPNLKIITHHCGGMVPYFEERIKGLYDLIEVHRGGKEKLLLTKAPIEYFKMFYNDTAIYGNSPALMCAHAFFGADHLLFGADMPLGDSQLGYRNYRQTINAINLMDISDIEKKKIFEDNARSLLHLPI